MSNEAVRVVIDLLSYLTILGGVVAVVSGALLLKDRFSPASDKSTVAIWSQTLSIHSLPLIFLFASVATLGSLFLSEVAGFTPCKLCWFQRIFMYPLALLSGLALFVGDKKIFRYILLLALIGLGVAIYHYLIQMFPESIQCSDEVASCAARQAARFGFITIPFMAGVAFLNIILLSVWGLKSSQTR